MAQKKKTTRRSTATRKRKTAPILSEQRKKEVFGLILMVIALFISLAIITYDPHDDVFVKERSFFETLFPNNLNEQNALGLLGARIAYILVPSFLGYASLLLAVLLLVTGYLIFRNRSTKPMGWIAIGTLLVAIFIACFAGLLSVVSGNVAIASTAWSGAIGAGISQWLHNLLGTFGAFTFFFLLVAIIGLIALDRDIQKTLDRVEAFFARLTSGLKDWYQSIQENKLKEKDKQKPQVQPNTKSASSSSFSSKSTLSPSSSGRSIRYKEEEAIKEVPTRPVEPSYQKKNRLQNEFDDLDIDIQQEKAPVATLPTSQDLTLTIRTTEKEQEAKQKIFSQKVRVEDINYALPAINLLDYGDDDELDIDEDELEENKQILIEKLDTYNIEITNIEAVVGPTVTLYELTPAPGVKISRIRALEDDLAMALAARGIRIIAPIPGKSAIGIEIPNRHRELVRIYSVLNTAKFQNSAMELPVVLGKTIEGKVHLEDLAKMPHLLIAGATGAGKSVGVNTMIAGLLYSKHPADLKFVMIDPKKIELQQYKIILDHFVAMPEGFDTPIITDFSQALGVLKSCEKEMELRYDLLSNATVRGIKDYNIKYKSGKLDPSFGHRYLPYIVVVIDELADLMMTAGKDIEGPIARLAQMARAVGIHLVLATQRPSVDVITGLIKANFPSRIAYQVASKIDSRTILDQNGAERLVGNGDMLYMNGSRVIRLQGPFISVEEVDQITEFIASQEGVGPYMLPSLEEDEEDSYGGMTSVEDRDDLFKEAAKIIVLHQQGSVSLLQRKLSIGYTRAARIVDQLEEAGIVGPFEGSKARQVYIPDEAALEMHLDLS